MTVDARGLLRPGLLEGVTLAVAASREAPLAAAVGEAAAGLGAAVAHVRISAGGEAEIEEQEAEAALAAALESLGSLDGLIVDAGSLFAGAGGQDTLIACLASVWNAARVTAGLVFLPEEAGGRIVLLAPPAGGEYAGPVAAGLENLARTLSIEWARHGITAVAVAPGEDTSAGELAALACYLLSPAGAYFSGCLMDLRGPRR